MHKKNEVNAGAKPSKRPGTKVSELESHLGYWLRFVSNHVSQEFSRLVEGQGVSVSEWVILRETYRMESSSPAALAQVLGMTKGAVSKLLDRLLAKQLILRTVSDEDRRNHHIELSAEGRALVPVLSKLADHNDEQFFGHMHAPLRQDIMQAMMDIVRMQQLKTIPVE